jgi:hypothetical protein
MKITSHTCPRDCFDACGILAHVNDNGQLVKVTSPVIRVTTTRMESYVVRVMSIHNMSIIPIV